MSKSGMRSTNSSTQVTMGKDSKAKSSPLQKLVGIFKRERNTENGSVPVPSCFADDRYPRRSESPEAGAGGRPRSNSVGNRAGFKLWRGDKPPGSRPLWKPKGRCEWESDSGRHLTLQETPISELSKVEIQMLQRIAINLLQEKDIPVSHGMLKSLAGNRNMLGRLSFNSFNKRKISTSSTEKPPETTGVFGLPLTAVCTKDNQVTKSSVSSTPSTPGRRISSPSSPTNSENSSTVEEVNPTAALLEALSVSTSMTSAPSPQTIRRQSLCPVDPQVPLIVRKAIAHLDNNGVKTEGLFRVPGAKLRIAEIRGKIDSGDNIELDEDTNPHDVACLLKEFLRNLPEPLLTKELYTSFLATRKIENPGQRRDILRLLCVLLPQPNRDTLQELLQFLSRVALRSNGIILIDGTEETGNRMTEQNLATILGPNLLHKDIKPRKGSGKDYQIVKQDAEELTAVCKVMEDLIRMQKSIFMISPDLLHKTLKDLLEEDPSAVEQLLKRKCIEMGLFLSQQEGGLDNVSELDAPGALHACRTLSDAQQSLEEAIQSLQKDLDEELFLCKTTTQHQHYSSNDSAMDGSEAVLSPLLEASGGSTSAEGMDGGEPAPGSRVCKHQAYDSVDSAFSNTSSPTAFGEGRGGVILVRSESGREEERYHPHNRMSSCASGVSSVSPEPVKMSQFNSMPTLRLAPDATKPVFKSKSGIINIPGRHLPRSGRASSKRLHWTGTKNTSFEIVGDASYLSTSPILRSRERGLFGRRDERREATFLDQTPTESMSSVWDSEEGTVI